MGNSIKGTAEDRMGRSMLAFMALLAVAVLLVFSTLGIGGWAIVHFFGWGWFAGAVAFIAFLWWLWFKLTEGD
jgi:predicted MFS family arabinose efflux permease